MSRLTLKLKAAPTVRIDLTGLAPAIAAGASVQATPVMADGHMAELGDLFAVSGNAGGEIVIEGSHGRLDGVGAGLAVGTLLVEGSVGDRAAAGMKGGRLVIKGDAGHYLATSLKGGTVHVGGSAGNFVGGVSAGKRFGMVGGNVIVDGNLGSRAGDKMRRGLILARGTAGEAAGSRMIGGTIVAEQGFGAAAGQLMRRGSLIGPSIGHLLPTFADCGVHDLVILGIMARAYARELGPLAPKALPTRVRRLMGDLATIGKGEILLTTV